MLTNPLTIKEFYYKDPGKLHIRKEFWRKYGNNNVSYNQWILRQVWLRNNDPKKITILDAWCGRGDFLDMLSLHAPNTQLYWVDISSEVCEVSRMQLWNRASIYTGDIWNLHFENDAFDFIFSLHVFHHIENKDRVFKEFKRIIQPHWTVVIVIGNYHLDSWLNKIHYEGLELLAFPEFMKDKKPYQDLDVASFEKKVKLYFDNTERHIYENNAIIYKKDDIWDIMAYYTSAMMYRWSSWDDDIRIGKEKWESLYSYVRERIIWEIWLNWSFYQPWEVVLYKLYN